MCFLHKDAIGVEVSADSLSKPINSVISPRIRKTAETHAPSKSGKAIMVKL